MWLYFSIPARVSLAKPFPLTTRHSNPKRDTYIRRLRIFIFNRYYIVCIRISGATKKTIRKQKKNLQTRHKFRRGYIVLQNN